MLSFLSLAALALVAPVLAQGPSTLDLRTVDAQYVASGFAARTNTGFGVALTSTALLTVSYPGLTVTNGSPYTAAQVATLPTFALRTAANATNTTATAARYTYILADAASLGDPDLEGNYRHFLANGASANGTGGTVVTSYAGPGPLPGSGVHRYSWLVFSQTAAFTPPAGLATAGVAPGHWNVSTYAATPGLTLIAASFFTVVNGTPTGATVATTAVNTATLVAAATSGSAGPVASGSTVTAGTGAAAPVATSAVPAVPRSSASTLAVSLFASSALCATVLFLA